MNENLFNETFFKKNNYFRKELNISQDQLKDIQALIKNWQRNCESFNPDVDKETTDENEFVDILFKKILGYSGKGADSDNYNILPKFKIDGASATGKAGYADLALGYFSKSPLSPFTKGGSWINAEVVVEFKGQDSDNLTKLSNRPDKLSPVDQCWKYLVNHTSAKWGIVTNFNEIRIYNKEKGQNVYETFYFNVPEEDKHKFLPLSTETEILKLITILKKENLLTTNGVSKTGELLKNKGVEETKVLKEFYSEYKSLRSQIFYEALKYNTQYETERPKSELLQLVQKFLDRIIFCWFCEDSREHLIPSNVLSADLIQAQAKDKYYNPQHFSIYGKVKDLFQAIDEGHAFGIESGYNGELFKVDALLDALKLPNFLFEKIAEIGMKYDFGDENELNVNILGHIFEQSISDLEEMRVSFQELDQSPRKIEKQHVMEFAKEVEVLEHKHTEFDAKKTKRKKEGVFYTPDYITRYMVENTVGAWLDKKFKLVEEKYKNTKRNKEFNIWIEFRDEYLCKIKILDPACGSGAFLIAAFNYLLAKHKEVYEKLKELRKKKESDEAYLLHPDNFDKTILENNLYGVDLNRESVEITKLALWLKTAVKNRKLNNLSDHIKCGNSLIDDEAIVGKELAFNWEKRFPAIMNAGGFDVVVGNPPYVRIQNLKHDEIDWFKKHKRTAYQRIDISLLFFELGFNLINNNGILSYISSSQWMSTEYGIKLREFFSKGYIFEIVDFGSLPVFDSADTYPAIFLINKTINSNIMYKKIASTLELSLETIKNKKNIVTNSSILKENTWSFDSFNLYKHLKNSGTNFVEFNSIGNPYYGIITGCDEAFIVTDKIIKENQLEANIIYPFAYKGEEVFKHSDIKPQNSIIYPYEKINSKTQLIPEKEMKNNYPNIYKYLSKHKDKLIARKDSRRIFAGDNNWYAHVRAGTIDLINSEKLLFKGISKDSTVGYLKKETAFSGANCPAVILNGSTLDIRTLIALLNSKVISFYLIQVCPKKLGGYSRFNTNNISTIPIVTPEDQQPFMRLTDIMLTKNKELQEIQKEFTTLLVSEFSTHNPALKDGAKGKLEDWYLLDWSAFSNELKKKKIVLEEEQEVKWLKRFERMKKEALAIKAVIDSTDKEIDILVYRLYDLTFDEVKIVEPEFSLSKKDYEGGIK